jgi:uncharacterized protein
VQTFMNQKVAPVWRRLRGVLIILGLCLTALAFARPKTLPEPSGYVNDFANIVEPQLERQISDICRELDQKTGVQIGVASLPNIGGEDIDGYTSRLFEQWNPGQKGVNNGILIVDAIEERQLRIEIGYGLEGIIPDAVAGRIRRDIMTPLLAQNKHGEAYLAGIASLAKICADDAKVSLESLSGVRVPQAEEQPTAQRRGRNFPFFIPFIVFAIIMATRRRRGFFGGGGPWIGGGFGGGGFGGGGGGFGGFGGGMSGGGGSSGGY